VIEPGRRLGRFEVLSLLGLGGMGEVYCARDTQLGRDVAVKILPASLAHDSQRRARIEREARLLAALNHPGIATIHELFEADGIPVLVMELVQGQTLASTLRRGALPVRQALEIALQIAAALEAAHAKGILHRDLKPSNIFLSENGRVKLVDFGLGKAVESGIDARSSGEALSEPANASTATGVVLGTAPYMSPEQARGEELDKRTDIWAFGCVLYELLAGERAFPGLTSADAVAAVLQRDPEWQALPAAMPRTVGRLLQRCLRKARNERLQDIGDARLEIMRRSKSQRSRGLGLAAALPPSWGPGSS
jgi:eukaryotic-like serine/threonine-protein kinase